MMEEVAGVGETPWDIPPDMTSGFPPKWHVQQLMPHGFFTQHTTRDDCPNPADEPETDGSTCSAPLPTEGGCSFSQQAPQVARLAISAVQLRAIDAVPSARAAVPSSRTFIDLPAMSASAPSTRLHLVVCALCACTLSLALLGAAACHQRALCRSHSWIAAESSVRSVGSVGSLKRGGLAGRASFGPGGIAGQEPHPLLERIFVSVTHSWCDVFGIFPSPLPIRRVEKAVFQAHRLSMLRRTQRRFRHSVESLCEPPASERCRLILQGRPQACNIRAGALTANRLCRSRAPQIAATIEAAPETPSTRGTVCQRRAGTCFPLADADMHPCPAGKMENYVGCLRCRLWMAFAPGRPR